jgi:hypothetical protein
MARASPINRPRRHPYLRSESVRTAAEVDDSIESFKNPKRARIRFVLLY